MFYPYAYGTLNIPKSEEKILKNLLTNINKEFDLKSEIGSAAEVLNYLSPGNCLDYAYSVTKVNYAYAWEIYKDHYSRYDSFLQISEEADPDECFRTFNPTNHEELVETLDKWSKALEKTIKMVCSK